MLELKKISKEYLTGSDSVVALRDVSISFRHNEFVSILGPSGCGKTTLLNIIGGLDRYTSGDLVIRGISTKAYSDGDWDVYRNRSIGFVFQSYNLIPHQSVLSNVELAMTLSGVSKAERRRRAIEALEKVGLGDQIKKRPSQMSGGQMQRVAIARALVNNPDILLADEPTGALDTSTSEQVMQLLSEVARDRLVIMVTHNPDLADRFSTRIISLKDGEIVGDTMPYTPDTDKAADSTPKNTQNSAEQINKKAKKQKKTKKKPMSLITALSLSKNNLLTKKTRTFLTSFAGSIGIIGIALILSLSNGIQTYINNVQKDTLSSYPIQLMAEEVDMSSILAALMESEEKKANREDGRVYANTVMYEMLTSYIGAETKKNNLREFKKFIEDKSSGFFEYASAVQYGYDTPLYIFSDTEFGIKQVEPSNVFSEVMPEGMQSSMTDMGGMMSGSAGVKVWCEMLPSVNESELINELIYDQYDLIYGAWPKDKGDIVVILNQNNEVSDMSLYALGLKDSSEVKNMMNDILAGKKDENYGDVSYSYEEICALKFKLLLPDDYYKYDAQKDVYVDMRDNDTFMSLLMNDEETGVDLRISAIIKPNPDAVSTALSGTIGYTSSLTEYVIEKTNSSEVIKAQKNSPRRDIINGLLFDDGTLKDMTEQQKAERFISYVNTLSTADKAALYTKIASTPIKDQLSPMIAQILSAYPDKESKKAAIISAYSQAGGMDADSISGYVDKMTDEEIDNAMLMVATAMAEKSYEQNVTQSLAQLTAEQLSSMLDSVIALPDNTQALAEYHDTYMKSEYSDMTFDKRLKDLGQTDLESPSSISIFADTFSDKEEIAKLIEKYNEKAKDEDKISYTDYVALMMSGISTIIDVISYVLVAFVSISLVVSSIMIGIITYISVLERTKEIGILRAIGASKSDISRVFNAETLIVGLVSGLIGIITTLLLCIPTNAIIRALSGITNIGAILPPAAAIILVAISMGLTFIAGLVPAKIAAKKDPVVALRSE